MKIGIVGCGFVAAFYAKNAREYPDIQIAGAFDIQAENLKKFCEYYSIPAYETLDKLLAEPSIELILNLTNPRSHYAVTKACLEAGKHVYTEKPVAMDSDQAHELLDFANQKGLRIGCAPCNALGNTAQTIWKAIQEGQIGKVKLVYANYDDGMIAPKMRPWEWKNEFGVAWPAKDEFEIGCTYEHAAYFLGCLSAIFGPARSVTAFASCQVPDKGIPVDSMAPDFSVGCLEYDDGVVARVTCGLVAPRDKSLMVVGDKGYLFVRYLRNDSEQVFIRHDTVPKNLKRIENLFNRIRLKFKGVQNLLPWPIDEFFMYEKYPFALPLSQIEVGDAKRVDFMLGPYDMIQAIKENRPHRLTGEFGVHLLEQIEVLQYPEKFGYRRELTSTFPNIQPLQWT